MQEEVEEMVADVIRDEAPGPDFTESVQALMRQARELFQEVQYGAAVPVLESAREQAPDDTLVSMLLARPYVHPECRGPAGGSRRLLQGPGAAG